MNTTGNIPYGVQAFYDRNLLERALPAQVYDKFGQMRPIPKNNTNSIKFRKWNALPPAMNPLVEGVTPAGSNMSVTDITATLIQYGDFTILTDIIEMTVEDRAVKEATDVLGEQAGLTVDTAVRDELMAGTNVIVEGGGATASAPISEATVKNAVKTLKGQNAKMFTDMIKGSVRVNTYPIKKGYIGICHTDVTSTLEGFSKWRGVEEYGSTQLVDINEVGTFSNVRFVETTNAPKEGDIYKTIILGKNAYGVVSLRGNKNITTIVKPLGSAGSADPLNQRSSVGWKALITSKILNDAWIVRIESQEA